MLKNDEMKKLVRKHFLEIRRTIKEEYLVQNQAVINDNVINYLEQNNVKSIGIYLPIEQENEVDTEQIIKYCLNKNIAVFVPRWDKNKMDFYQINNLENDIELVDKKYLEPLISNPKLANKIDAIFIPLVAFDKKNNRLGYGAGYYDKWLKNHSDLYNKKIGLGWKFQSSVMPLPVDELDQKLDLVITDDIPK